MKSKAIVCAVVIASMGLGSLAQAQDRGRRGPDDDRWSQQDRGRHDNGRSNDRRDDRRDDRHDDRHDDRRDGHWDNRHWDGHPGYYGARGPDFRRGGYIPYEYRRPIYVVNNYYGHRLPAPPRGHQWVQVGADYVLIAIATGIIAQIILNQ